MGLRGPAPKPNSKHTLAGTNTYHVRNPRTRKGPAPMVTPPASLMQVPEAMRFWKQHANDLRNKGHLLPAMAETFGQLCMLFADIRRLEDAVAESGDVITANSGRPMMHPNAVLLRAARNDFAKLAREFAMTPLAAARVPHEKDATDEAVNPLAAFGIIN